MSNGPCKKITAAVDAKTQIDRLHVDVYGVTADREAVGNLLFGVAQDHELQRLPLSWRKLDAWQTTCSEVSLPFGEFGESVHALSL